MFLWTAVAVCMMAVFVTAIIRARKDRVAFAAAEKLALQKQERLDKERLDAGTHVKAFDGTVKPKCRYNCPEPATKKPFMWARSERVWDLIRRMFGAPARMRIKRDKMAELAACTVHDPLAFEEFRMEHAEYEVDRAKLESVWETRRARFQREGVHERVLAKIERHQLEIGGRRRKKTESKSNVVQLPRTGSS